MEILKDDHQQSETILNISLESTNQFVSSHKHAHCKPIYFKIIFMCFYKLDWLILFSIIQQVN